MDCNFKKDKYGFWKQENPQPIVYDEEYKRVQKTTSEMAWLRIGFLASYYNNPSKTFSEWKVCDVGSGNGKFAQEAKKVFKEMKEYDLSGETITQDELYGTKWDLILLTDVLEHFTDIDDLWKMNFDRILVSFPETPEVEDWKELVGWRHFRPNEHIYCLESEILSDWFYNHGLMTMGKCYLEDLIRKGNDRNICTLYAKKVYEK